MVEKYKLVDLVSIDKTACEEIADDPDTIVADYPPDYEVEHNG